MKDLRPLDYRLMLATILYAALPLFSLLPKWIAFAAIGTIALAYGFRFRKNFACPRIILLLVMCGYAVLLFRSFGTLLGTEPSSSLLLFLVILKQYEKYDYRSSMLSLLVICLVVMAAALLDQSLFVTIHAISTLVLVMACFSILHRTDGGPSQLVSSLKSAAKLIIFSLPLSAAMFVFFPRISAQIFHFSQSTSTQSGFSDTLEPGSVSELVLSDRKQFRVDFENQKIPPLPLQYWRAAILTEQNGMSWQRGSGQFIDSTPAIDPSQEFKYRVLLEPQTNRWLFALENTNSLHAVELNNKIRISKTDESTFEVIRPLGTQLVYQGVATLAPSLFEGRIGKNSQSTSPTELRPIPPLTAQERDIYLQVEDDKSEELRALVAEFRRLSPKPEVRVHAVLDYLQTGFRYTLKPGQMMSNSVSEFLFKKKQGFCEHFAGAFSSLMRYLGIPARVVVGFQGGAYNSLGNYILVSDRDAHAWSEVWLPSRGWIRVDPTSAIAPLRLEIGAAAFNDLLTKGLDVQGDLSSYLSAQGASSLIAAFTRQIQLVWDTVSYQWDMIMMNFDFDTQRALFAMLGWDQMSRTSLAIMTVLIAILLGITLSYSLTRTRRRKFDRVQFLYDEFCHLFVDTNPRRPSQGPLEYSQSLRGLNAQLDPMIDDFTKMYINARYGRRAATPSDVHSMSQLMQKIKKQVRLSV